MHRKLDNERCTKWMCLCAPVNLLSLRRLATTALGVTALGTTTLSARSALAAPVAFQHLRVKYSTTSDWAVLTLGNPQAVLSLRLMTTVGENARVKAPVDHIELHQPLAAAKARHSVGATVDYALLPSAVHVPLVFNSTKGDLNNANARVFLVGEEGSEKLLASFSHQGTQSDAPGRKGRPLQFSIPPSAFDSMPRQVELKRAALPRMLWAFYYLWYEKSNWTSRQLKDHPLAPYRSTDAATMKRQITQAKSAGIDGFMTSWWGPNNASDRAWKTLLQVAKKSNFSLAIYYETISHGAPRSETEIEQALSYLISTYHNEPAWMRVGGKPVIALWDSEQVPRQVWARVLGHLRDRGLDATFLAMSQDPADLSLFDGLHQYNPAVTPDFATRQTRASRATRYYGLLDHPSATKIFAASVQPGFDERFIPGRKNRVKSRASGNFYRSTWRDAVNSRPDWIFVTSWNEWWEDTEIEPGQRYGSRYLNLTRNLAMNWRNGHS